MYHLLSTLDYLQLLICGEKTPISICQLGSLICFNLAFIWWASLSLTGVENDRIRGAWNESIRTCSLDDCLLRNMLPLLIGSERILSALDSHWGSMERLFFYPLVTVTLNGTKDMSTFQGEKNGTRCSMNWQNLTTIKTWVFCSFVRTCE